MTSMFFVNSMFVTFFPKISQVLANDAKNKHKPHFPLTPHPTHTHLITAEVRTWVCSLR